MPNAENAASCWIWSFSDTVLQEEATEVPIAFLGLVGGLVLHFLEGSEK